MLALKRFLALWACLALPAWAMPQATVDAVQMPAWLERGGHSRPLAVGMELASGDRVRTGADARVYLKLPDGSTVKLGENAKFAVFGHSLKPRTAYKAALDVLAGAFRFTTDALQRVGSREVVVRVGTATAGIRGTDLWGRSDAREDLVCLIEGRIEIWHAAAPASVTMDEPMTFFVAPRGEVPRPVEAVDPREFNRWARQTEIEAGDGAVSRGGKWKLVAGRHGTSAEALAQYDALRNEGFAARIKPLAGEGGAWSYEVSLPGFADEREAAAAAARLKLATGVTATPAR